MHSGVKTTNPTAASPNMDTPPGLRPRQPCGSAHRGGLDIEFKRLTVAVGPGREILCSASGCIRAGELTALMGPSGAGKSTLLDVLAGRTQAARVEGSVRFGGRKLRPSDRQRLLAYVEQEDALVGNLSVLEMLQYTCELRGPPGMPAAEAKERAEAVVRELGLQSCCHSLIGGAGQLRGISGGQRRRVSIGVALVLSPSVLLLDEPTSGLDSRAALQVVDILRVQADWGLTVLASVHQPSERLLARFDSLLMAAGGQLVYQGPNGPEARQCLQKSFPATAAQLDSTLPLPDWLADCLEQAVRSGELGERVKPRPKPHHGGMSGSCSLPDTASLSSLPETASLPESASCEQLAGAEQLARQLRRKGPLACCAVLIKYRMWADYRSPLFLWPRIIDKFGLAFLMSTLYLGMGDKQGMDATFAIMNLLFMFVNLAAFSAVGFISSLMLETELFFRERHAGLYPIISYLLAKMVGEAVVLLFTSVVLATAVYFLAELSGSFLLLWLPYLMSMTIGIGIAYLCVAVSPTINVCLLLMAGYIIALLFLNGLVINWRVMPGYWKWFAVINYQRYAWGASMINQFTAEPRQFGAVDVLVYFGLDGQSAWGMLGIQCAFFFAYLLLAWGALVLREALPRWRRALGMRGWRLGSRGDKAVQLEQLQGELQPAQPAGTASAALTV